MLAPLLRFPPRFGRRREPEYHFCFRRQRECRRCAFRQQSKEKSARRSFHALREKKPCRRQTNCPNKILFASSCARLFPERNWQDWINKQLPTAKRSENTI